MHVVVVGAGLAGLVAATDLTAAGHRVTVFDKQPVPGGRIATRRIGAATVDLGAQFFTIRSDSFRDRMDPHLATGLVFEWCRGFSADGDGYPRYAVRGGMSALAEQFSTGLAVRCSSLVFTVREGVEAPWSVMLDDGSIVESDALIVTCPLPQAASLLMSAGITMPRELAQVDYDRTISALITMASSGSVPEPGGVQHPTDVLSFVADNVRKGVSDAPALTVHAQPEWSEAHWDDPLDDLATALTCAAQPFIGTASVTEVQIKRWRFATPRSIWPEPCWIAPNAPGPLVVAGDAFAGPKVEGAVLSGAAAGAAVAAALATTTT